MKKTALLILISLLFLYSQGQKRSVDYTTSLTGFVAYQNTLPFWAINNKHGLIPNGNGALLEIGLFSDFTGSPQNSIRVWGISRRLLIPSGQQHHFRPTLRKRTLAQPSSGPRNDSSQGRIQRSFLYKREFRPFRQLSNLSRIQFE